MWNDKQEWKEEKTKSSNTNVYNFIKQLWNQTMWDVLQVFCGGQLSVCFLTERELSTSYIWCMVRKGNNWSDALYEIHFLSENISQDLSHWFKCVDWKIIKLDVYINDSIFISCLDGHFCKLHFKVFGSTAGYVKKVVSSFLWLQRKLINYKLIISLRWCHSVAFSCIVGKVGASLCKGRRMHGMKCWVQQV